MNFQEKYKIIQKIGTGATASVFLAEDKREHQRRAVKIMKFSGFRAGQMALIRNEITIMRQLSLPQAPRLIEVIEGVDRVYIVMSYIPGMDLGRYVEKYGPLSVGKAVRWLLELCSILEKLHGMEPAVIFCDLKPENIIVQKDGTLALVDFGSACQCMQGAIGSEAPCKTGTKGYAAPELYEKNGWPDIRSDIYSLGAVGKFMLYPYEKTGAVGKFMSYPYKKTSRYGKAPWSKERKRLWGLLERCMETDKAKRYAACAELKDELLKNFI